MQKYLKNPPMSETRYELTGMPELLEKQHGYLQPGKKIIRLRLIDPDE